MIIKILKIQCLLLLKKCRPLLTIGARKGTILASGFLRNYFLEYRK